MNKHHIAIIDDDAAFAAMLAEQLTLNGYHAEVFDKPANFLKLPSLHFALIVIDLFMPELDGIAVLRELANRHYCGSIILVSGNDRSVLRTAFELAKVHNIKHISALAKPFTLQNFNRQVATLLSENATEAYKEQNLARTWQPSKENFQQALLEDQLSLFYQPKIQLRTGDLIGFEALLRWQHPQRGTVMPDQFIALAEQTGLITELTQYVIRDAIAQLYTWQISGLSTKVSVNISMLNLTELDFPERLAKLVSAANLLPEQLIMEITESALMSNSAVAMDVLIRLKMKGFHLSIDDFGTGYSSLAQLYRIPFSELKIDRRFVSAMNSDPESQAIVESCIALGHKLGLCVIAEGVEDDATLQSLSTLGCDAAQGYFWAVPMSAAYVPQWIKSRHQRIAI